VHFDKISPCLSRNLVPVTGKRKIATTCISGNERSFPAGTGMQKAAEASACAACQDSEA
jgi:hypothetical protein